MGISAATNLSSLLGKSFLLSVILERQSYLRGTAQTMQRMKYEPVGYLILRKGSFAEVTEEERGPAKSMAELTNPFLNVTLFCTHNLNIL
jgi:hypothetical protein